MGLSQEVDAHEWPHNLSQNINIHLLLRTNRINKWDPFLALVNLVEKKQINRCNGRSSVYFPDVEGCDNGEEENALL